MNLLKLLKDGIDCVGGPLKRKCFEDWELEEQLSECFQHSEKMLLRAREGNPWALITVGLIRSLPAEDIPPMPKEVESVIIG